MKLKTKFQDTVFGLGEVVEADLKEENNRIKVSIAAKAGGYHTFYYDSIEDFTNEWEDAYEEPKKYWYIEENGCIDFNYYDGGSYDEDLREIGNYFETEEQAKKAVEKLEACQRLKKKGLKFKESRICGSDFSVCFSLENHDDYQGSMEDFDKCFGGEENIGGESKPVGKADKFAEQARDYLQSANKVKKSFWNVNVDLCEDGTLWIDDAETDEQLAKFKVVGGE